MGCSTASLQRAAYVSRAPQAPVCSSYFYKQHSLSQQSADKVSNLVVFSMNKTPQERPFFTSASV